MFRLNSIGKKRYTCFIAQAAMAAFVFISAVSLPSFAAQEENAQVVFKSPEEAMKSLIEAIRADDMQRALAILGPEGEDVIHSGDEVADRNNRAKFVKAYQEKVNFVKDKDAVSVIIGKDSYPMAIPIAKRGEGWVFDTAAGRQELLNRRIGRNELSTIKSCREYVDAQKEYAESVRTPDGVIQYARKFCSAPGNRDGLYWEYGEEEEPSPLGPFFVAASNEGYTPGQVCMISPEPFRGYHYKILTAQGADAPGGAYNYIINGHMIAGFALAAWPAEYGVSGVMTFIVNQNGIVYEKDLGPRTEDVVKTIVEYNPDSTWSRAQ